MNHQECISLVPCSPPASRGKAGWASRLQALRSELDALEADLEFEPNGLGGISDVRTVIRARAERTRFFGADLFADPAWDILLELYACELSQQRLSVSKLTYASNVPATTVLRWLGVLEQQGLIARYPDPRDGRRVWISLSPAGSESMARYFEAVS